MKKRQLFSSIITMLLLCALLPTLAFADTIPDNPKGASVDVSLGDDMVNNYGRIWNNYGTVTNNNEYGEVSNNYGTVENNSGTVHRNRPGGTVTNNSNHINSNEGTVTKNKVGCTVNDNYGTVINNFGNVNNNIGGTVNNNSGTVYNAGTVTNNFRTVNNNTGTVVYNFGSATINGNSVTPQHQLWQVTVNGGEHTTNTLTKGNNLLWIEDDTGAAEFVAASGYTITAATTDKGSIANNNGTWTLTGVTEAATVTLTVAAVPKTGVDRDAASLTALALISGAVLLSALPKRKNRA